MAFFQRADYAKFYFQNEVLPKIIGATSFDKLKDPKRLARANAASAQSEIGGGAHGYLVIVDGSASYFELAGNDCILPAHPVPFVVAVGTTHREDSNLREEHREATHLFCETLDVENVI